MAPDATPRSPCSNPAPLAVSALAWHGTSASTGCVSCHMTALMQLLATQGEEWCRPNLCKVHLPESAPWQTRATPPSPPPHRRQSGGSPAPAEGAGASPKCESCGLSQLPCCCRCFYCRPAPHGQHTVCRDAPRMRRRSSGSPQAAAYPATSWCPTVWNIQLSSSSTASSVGSRLPSATICAHMAPNFCFCACTWCPLRTQTACPLHAEPAVTCRYRHVPHGHAPGTASC